MQDKHYSIINSNWNKNTKNHREKEKLLAENTNYKTCFTSPHRWVRSRKMRKSEIERKLTRLVPWSERRERASRSESSSLYQHLHPWPLRSEHRCPVIPPPFCSSATRTDSLCEGRNYGLWKCVRTFQEGLCLTEKRGRDFVTVWVLVQTEDLMKYRSRSPPSVWNEKRTYKPRHLPVW